MSTLKLARPMPQWRKALCAANQDYMNAIMHFNNRAWRTDDRWTKIQNRGWHVHRGKVIAIA